MFPTTSMDPKDFRNIISAFLSDDNETRKNAETVYEGIQASEKLVLLLSVVLQNDILPQETEIAAVLLRGIVTNEYEEAFRKLENEAQEEIKTHLLNRIRSDLDQNLRKKIVLIAAEMAEMSIDEDGNNCWPGVIKFLFDCAQSPDPNFREISLILFAAVPGVFGREQAKYLEIIHQMLSQSLSNFQCKQVCYAAAKATAAFFIENETKITLFKQFSDCVVLMLQFLGQVVLESEDEDPDDTLRVLVDLAETCPKAFRPHVDLLLSICLKGLSNPKSSQSCQYLSLEIIVSLCENAPAMVKKFGAKHISTTVNILLKMMTGLEDDANWDFADDDYFEDDNDSPTTAESALDRIACKLHGKTVLPLIMSTLPQMLNSSNWKDRYAGLMAISAIGEGCILQMRSMLPHIVDGILPFLGDSHPRVRYAACNALGQMSTDFAPDFQKTFHDKVISALLQVFSNPSSPRVQAHAGAALVNFFEECPNPIMWVYINSIVQTLEHVLSSKIKELFEKGTKLVLEQAVVTLSAVADCAQNNFKDFYEKFMPLLKYVVKFATQPHLRLLRGKTIECASLIGLAVGKDMFHADASEFMGLLISTHSAENPIPEDDPQLSYMIAAWARICKVLGRDFEPFLPHVMEPVLKAASMKPEIALVDTETMNNIESSEDWEFVNLGEKRNFGIRTTGLEEKATACEMLVCYARELKEGFRDYAEQTLQLMVPMLRFYFHDGVRIAASEILPHLLENARASGETYIQRMWSYILPSFWQAIESEPECEVLCEFLDNFSRCIAILNCPCMSHDELLQLINFMNKKINSHFERSEGHELARKEEDYDEVLEESFEKENDDDDFIMNKIGRMLDVLFAVYKQDLFTYFDMILPQFSRLIDPSRPWNDRHYAAWVFGDLVKHTGPASVRYQQYILQPLMRCVSDKNADIRQTAAYSIGLIGQFGGLEYAKFCSECLPILVQIINIPESRSDANEKATENVISAITKFMLFNNSLINANEIIPHFITWLPVWEDEEEVVTIFGFFCSLLEMNSPLILGNNNCNLPRIVQIIAEVFTKTVAIDAASEIGRRMINLLKTIQMNEEVYTMCTQQLSQSQRETLLTILSSQ